MPLSKPVLNRQWEQSVRMKAKTQYSSLNDRDCFMDVDRRQWLYVPRAKREIAHFAFDSAGISPIAARRDAFLQDLLQHGVMKGSSQRRGE
jgi:hypothetical protein